MTQYFPEGYLSSNRYTMTDIKQAISTNQTLEARAIVCDASHNLIVNLGDIMGIIPHNDCAIGVEEGVTKDIAIISRVNKMVSFKVMAIKNDEKFKPYAILSRRLAQEECLASYISYLTVGDIIAGKITHIEPFGCFVDIGCGIVALLPIDAISISRISHPKDRFIVGQNIFCIVKTIDSDGRICLSHKELLGTWEDNASMFKAGETVAGIIRSIENYGVFVELAPNLAGLAELKDNVTVGQYASVYIKNLIPEKMKVKLIIVDSFDDSNSPSSFKYFKKSGKIDLFEYSPKCCDKLVLTEFK